MSLHLSTAEVIAPAVPGLRRLSKKLLPLIQDYATAVQIKKEADAASAAAENTIKAHKQTILDAMEGSMSAICDMTVITRKDTKASEGALTLCNGSKVKWTEVTEVLIGNRHVPASEVLSLYGGRAGYTGLTVT